MNKSIVRIMILKDWRLHRVPILLSIAGGIAALSLLQLKTQASGFLGATWFFVSLIVLGSMMPISNVINERKKQTLPFMMSFPISTFQYTTAKLVSTVGMFLIPWVTLVIAGLSLIISRSDIPEGIIPMMLVLAGFTFVGFCVIASAALVSESEGWSIAATIACNSSYGFVWYLIIRNPAMRADLGSKVPVWSPIMLNMLGGQLAFIVLVLGITFYLQSRKRDFI